MVQLGAKAPHFQKKVQLAATSPTAVATAVVKLSTEACYHADQP